MNAHRKVLIIGEHPIKASIVSQFASLASEVNCESVFRQEAMQHAWDDIVVLTPIGSRPIESDAEAVGIVEAIHAALVHRAAEAADTSARPADTSDQVTGVPARPIVHLLLHSQETLQMLRTRDYKDEWHNVFELSAFTIDDAWARNVVIPAAGKSLFAETAVSAAEPVASAVETSDCMPGLDYRPITLDADYTVHLVVFGTSNLTTALVENAALVAHYPNYTRNHNLRTRITVIAPDVEAWSHAFIGRHKPLMGHAYYRHINLANQHCDLHRPMYENSREDFVDVEWEFVCGSLHDLVVQDKLQGWAATDTQVLSVALCHENDADNLAQMQLAADLLCGIDVPIYVRQRSAAFAGIIASSPRLQHVVLIGMADRGYDVTLPLLRMAQRVKYVYDYCYDHNVRAAAGSPITAPSSIDPAEAAARWLHEGKAIKRYSNECNAMTIATKMRSLGTQQLPSPSATTVYAITQSEIELIAEVEHNRWSVEELLLGFRPCTDEEQAAVEADITLKAALKERLVHYDLRAYRDLRPDATDQNVNTYDLCLSASIPLICHNKVNEIL